MVEALPLTLAGSDVLKRLDPEQRPLLWDRHPRQSFPSSHSSAATAYVLSLVDSFATWWASRVQRPGTMPKESSGAKTLRGTVVAHNISPRGEIEGMLLESSGTTVQVNFPRHHQAELSARMQLATSVELLVEPQESEGAHPVYVASGTSSRVEGVVSQLNYTRHGEVNGYRLEDGTFVHVKPQGARSAKISVGDRIAAAGVLRVGSQAAVIDTDHVKKLPQAGR